MRDNYLVEHTVGSIIGGAFKIYFRHFGTLFLIFILPVVPVAMMQGEALLSGSTVFIILSVLLMIIVNQFAYAATTVAVSDVCLGNAPSFKRAYAKILGKLVLLLLVTNLLQILAIAIGMVLLVIPAWCCRSGLFCLHRSSCWSAEAGLPPSSGASNWETDRTGATLDWSCWS
jgi:hypothetical protein